MWISRWTREEKNGQIPDVRRIQWYREALAELARAIADGARVRAFHAWTLLDNFQWAEGYTERYGLIYTDFRNQKRTIKDSGFGTVESPLRIASTCEFFRTVSLHLVTGSQIQHDVGIKHSVPLTLILVPSTAGICPGQELGL